MKKILSIFGSIVLTAMLCCVGFGLVGCSNEITVRFELYGLGVEEMDSIVMAKGSLISPDVFIEPTSIDDSFTFDGWLNQNYNPIRFDKPLNEDTIFRAQWVHKDFHTTMQTDEQMLVWYPHDNTKSTYELPTFERATVFIGDFRECVNLKSITIPDNIRKIHSRAFEQSPALEEIILPNDLISIGMSAFYNCTSLEEIILPDSLTVLENSLFRESGIKELDVPAAVTSIGDYAFMHSALANITMQNNVTSIGAGAFINTKLQEITLSNKLTAISEELFAGSLLEQITLPNSIKTIGDSAFLNCQSLSRITIPQNVTAIGRRAFENVANGFTLTIDRPSSMGLITLGEDAMFLNGLTAIIVPDAASVTAYSSAPNWSEFASKIIAA